MLNTSSHNSESKNSSENLIVQGVVINIPRDVLVDCILPYLYGEILLHKLLSEERYREYHARVLNSVFQTRLTDEEYREVQMGDYLGEDDIIRYSDVYGRL